MKELKTLLKLLRSQGVLKYTTPELSLEFSEETNQSEVVEDADPAPKELQWEEMSEYQRMMFSATSPITTDEQ